MVMPVLVGTPIETCLLCSRLFEKEVLVGLWAEKIGPIVISNRLP